MPPTRPQPLALDADVEHDYAEHRAAVLAMLRAEFPRLADPEELYQEAWAELLELEARGETVHRRRALLKTIAWRRAADATKRRQPDAVDPFSPALASIADEQPLPDEQAQLHLDGEALRVLVESLDVQQAAVLKLRFQFQLSAREVQGHLGVSEKRLEAIVTAAYKKLADQLAIEDGETRWARRQRSLLLACELGIATARQRRRAQSMVDRDPVCRAMLRAVRASLNDIAVALPMPVLAAERERVGALARATGRLDELWVTARQLQSRITGRGAPDSQLLEHAGAGGAAIGAGTVATKVVVVCLAIGGSGAICIDVAHQLRDHPAKAAARSRHVTRATVEPARDHGQVVALRHATTSTTTTNTSSTTARRQTPVSSPKSTPAASPAPAGSSEFGPGNVGSTAASTQPAPAPQDGGGEFTP